MRTKRLLLRRWVSSAWPGPGWRNRSTKSGGGCSFPSCRSNLSTRGRNFFAAPRSFASSQICSLCNVKYGPKPLNDREWECPKCLALLDLDYNSRTNLTVAAGQAQLPLSGLLETLNARGGRVRRLMASAVVAPPEETGTSPNSAITNGSAHGNPDPSGPGGCQRGRTVLVHG